MFQHVNNVSQQMYFDLGKADFYATIFPNFSKHRYNLPAMPKGKGRSLFRLKTKKNWNDLSPSSIN